jgi:hypothetical protein
MAVEVRAVATEACRELLVEENQAQLEQP